MLFCKSLHKGNFIKEIFKGNFTQNSKSDQLLVVTEKSLELYDYISNGSNIPFLEPNFNQEMFLHILDCKVMLYQKTRYIILLCTCGILVLTYSEETKSFVIIASEILNTHTEPRDRLMYLTCYENFGVIVAYSNTNSIFIFKLSIEQSKLNLLNGISSKITGNIIEILFKELKYFRIEVLVKIEKFYVSDIFIFDEKFQIINDLIEKNEMESFSLQFNSVKNNLYRVIKSPHNSFLFLFHEDEFSCVQILNDNNLNVVHQKKFKSTCNILSSYVYFENFLQLNFEDKIYIFEEDVYNKKIKKLKVECISYKQLMNKKVIRTFENDYNFVYYDEKMNLVFTYYHFELYDNKMKIVIKVNNSYSDNSFYCLDSVLKNDYLYGLCGFKGNSKLVKFEKSLIETKFHSFEFPSTNKIFYIVNTSGDISFFLTTADKTYKFKLDNKYKFTSVNLDSDSVLSERIINITQFNDIYAIVSSESIVISSSDEDKILKRINLPTKIISGSSFVFNNEIYFCLYLISRELLIYSIKNEEKLFQLSYNENVSCFDIVIHPNSQQLILVICTYNNSIDLYTYDFNSQSLNKSSSLNLTNDDLTQIIPECIRIFDNFMCISTRSGEFCIFNLSFVNNNNENELSISNLIYSYTFPDTKDVLYIADLFSNYDFNGKEYKRYSFHLYNSTNAMLLDVKIDELMNFKVEKFKYNIEKEISFIKNFKMSESNLTLYQINKTIYLSNFSKPMNNTLSPKITHEFKINEFARKIVLIDDIFIILVENFTTPELLLNTLFIFPVASNNCCNIIDVDVKIKFYSMKTFSLIYEDQEVKYLGLCGNYLDDKKGVLFIYEHIPRITNEIPNQLRFIKKLNLGQPGAYDFCLIKDYLILSCEGDLAAIRLDLDNKQKKVVFTASSKQPMSNKIISLNAITNSYCFISGDCNESFSLIEFDPRKQRFDANAVDMSLRMLSNAIPDTDNSVILHQKNGIFSKFVLKEELYCLTNCYDIKEYINRMHFIKPFYLCTTILGSVYSIFEISFDDIQKNYGINYCDINEFQENLVKLYSKGLFGREMSLELMRNMSEPSRNAIMIDLYDTMIKSGQFNPKVNSKYEKIIDLINYLSELSDNII